MSRIRVEPNPFGQESSSPNDCVLALLRAKTGAFACSRSRGSAEETAWQRRGASDARRPLRETCPQHDRVPHRPMTTLRLRPDPVSRVESGDSLVRMSDVTRQMLLICAAGVLLVALTVSLTRRRLLSLRYAIGWLALGVGGILGALLSFLVAPVSRFLGLTATGLLLAIATITLLAVSILLSVAVSKLQSNIRDLAENQALISAHVADDSTLAEP